MTYQEFAGAIVTWLSKYTRYPDKVAHAIAGLLIQGVVAAIAAYNHPDDPLLLPASMFIGALAAFVAGALKEIYDWWSYGDADGMDLMATAMPALVVAAILAAS